MNHRRLCTTILSAAVCLAACSDSKSPVKGRTTTGAGGASTGPTSTGSSGGTAGTGLGGTWGAGGSGGGVIIGVPDASLADAPAVDATCAGSVSEAHLIPLDLFIMLDQSSSMEQTIGSGIETRWTAVTKAIASFVKQPEANGIGVGINYFGVSLGKRMCLSTTISCMKDADCAPGCGPCVPLMGGSTQRVCKEVFGDIGADMCDVANYNKAETPIAELPGNAQAILESLARHEPTSSTPTSAALQGSVDFCRQWANGHAGRVVVNVFATDGEPADCDEVPANIERIAATAFGGMPSIRTFVIGVGDDVGADAGSDAKQLLDGIARAGGTTRAFTVSDADVNRQFLDALNQIRGSALACAYTIPDSMGRMPDYTKVNVRYTPGGSTTSVVIPKVAGPADCADRDGWYYDNEANPSRILMCEATCKKFSMDTKGKVEIEVGCATIIAPPPR